jgi:uncharacterized membrane protein YbhN (UPF0104 family)
MQLKVSKFTKIVIAAAIVIVIFFFLGRTLYLSWPQVSNSFRKADILLVAISIIFLVASSLLGLGYSWFLALKLFSKNIRFWQAMRTSAFAQFGKYIPGKIWTYGGRIALAKMYGVGEAEGATALLIETVTSASSAVIIFIISILTYGNISLPINIYFVLLLIPLSFILIHPRILVYILRFLSKLLRKEIVQADLKFSQLLKIYLFYFSSWVVHTLGFYFITRALFPIPFNKCLGVMGAYAISWTIGFFVFLIPGGFGVREGLLTLILQNFMPLPFATLMAVIGRFWTTIGELLFALIAFLKKQ